MFWSNRDRLFSECLTIPEIGDCYYDMVNILSWFKHIALSFKKNCLFYYEFNGMITNSKFSKTIWLVLEAAVAHSTKSTWWNGVVCGVRCFRAIGFATVFIAIHCNFCLNHWIFPLCQLKEYVNVWNIFDSLHSWK